MEHQWIISEFPAKKINALSSHLGIPPLIARLLLSRGIEDLDEAREFLYPSVESLHSPYLFRDMKSALECIRRAMRAKSRICIFGDYDVDGVTSIAMLTRFFRLLDYPVDFRVPSRIHDGYGLNEAAVAEIAGSGGGLLITVDCGTSDYAEIETARGLGLDVIVVDHHEHSGARPPACAILNPKFGGDGYPFRDLAGVGVAFKLVDALVREMSPDRRRRPEVVEFMRDALGLAALGSVADVVPLRAENRIIVSHGLKTLADSSLVGIRALLKVGRIAPEEMKTWHIAFNMAPRINAAGRLGDAAAAVRLLITDDPAEAADIAGALDRENNERRKICDEIFSQAESLVEEQRDGGEPPKAIVLADERWHSGVIGIVASRLVEKYYRPVVLVALSGDKGRGSARSIPPYNIYEGFTQSAEATISYGGHKAAAGLEISADRIDDFRRLLCADVDAKLGPDDLMPKMKIDAAVELKDLDFELLDKLSLLAPYGTGNPSPLFVLENVFTAGRPQLMGRGNKHISFRVQDGDEIMRAVAFNSAHIFDEIISHRTPVSIAFRPKVSSFSGRIEIDVRDIRINRT